MRAIWDLGTVVAAALITAAGGWVTGDAALWHVAWGLAGTAVVAALVLPAPIAGIQVERLWDRGPHWTGDPLTVTFRLTVPGGWFWWYISVSDATPGVILDAPTLYSASGIAWRRRTVDLPYRVPSLPRGVYEWSRVVVETGDPWGFVRRRRVVERRITLEVWPRPTPIRWQEPPPPVGESTGRAASYGPSAPEVSGVRAMQSGDPWTRVHWRSTARTGRPMVKQQPTLGLDDVWVEVEPPARFSPSEYEEALCLAAGVIQEAVSRGHRVGLRLDGLVVQPVGGRTGAQRLLGHLARAPQAVSGAEPAAMPPQPGTILIARESGDSRRVLVKSSARRRRAVNWASP